VGDDEIYSHVTLPSGITTGMKYCKSVESAQETLTKAIKEWYTGLKETCPKLYEHNISSASDDKELEIKKLNDKLLKLSEQNLKLTQEVQEFRQCLKDLQQENEGYQKIWKDFGNLFR
jgi:chromosome segregation ATPase